MHLQAVCLVERFAFGHLNTQIEARFKFVLSGVYDIRSKLYVQQTWNSDRATRNWSSWICKLNFWIAILNKIKVMKRTSFTDQNLDDLDFSFECFWAAEVTCSDILKNIYVHRLCSSFMFVIFEVHFGESIKAA